MAYHGVTKLALGDVNLTNLQETKNEIDSKLANVEILLLELDVTSESSVDQAMQKAAATFGRVDYAVNNAGISGPFAPTENVAFSDWRRLLDVNLDGVWRCQRAELQQMMKQDLQEAG
jgi:NAD(P)-dependent dehydrogenase (short-subunit alcohol dehydrogenase family)